MHLHANLIELEARNNGSYVLVSDIRCQTYKKSVRPTPFFPLENEERMGQNYICRSLARRQKRKKNNQCSTVIIMTTWRKNALIWCRTYIDIFNKRYMNHTATD